MFLIKSGSLSSSQHFPYGQADAERKEALCAKQPPIFAIFLSKDPRV